MSNGIANSAASSNTIRIGRIKKGTIMKWMILWLRTMRFNFHLDPTKSSILITPKLEIPKEQTKVQERANKQEIRRSNPRTKKGQINFTKNDAFLNLFIFCLNQDKFMLNSLRMIFRFCWIMPEVGRMGIGKFHNCCTS